MQGPSARQMCKTLHVCALYVPSWLAHRVSRNADDGLVLGCVLGNKEIVWFLCVVIVCGQRATAACEQHAWRICAHAMCMRHLVRCELAGCGGGLEVGRWHRSCDTQLGNRRGLGGRSSDHRSLGDSGVGLGLHHGRGSRHGGLVRGLSVVLVVQVRRRGARRGLLPRQLRQLAVVLLLPLRPARWLLQCLQSGLSVAQSGLSWLLSLTLITLQP